MSKFAFIIILMLFCVNVNAVEVDTTTFKWRYEKYQSDKKDPRLAFFLSWVMPGVGQFYNGKFRSGMLNLMLTAGLLGVVFYTGEDCCFCHRGVDEHPYATFGAVGLLVHMVVSGNNAHSLSVKNNESLMERYGISHRVR